MKSSGLLFFVIFGIIYSCSPALKKEESRPVPDVRVLLDRVTQRDSIVFKGTYTMISEEARYEFGSKNQRVYISPFVNGFKIFNSNRIFVFRPGQKVVFRAQNDAEFKFQSRWYKGDLFILTDKEEQADVINRINLEDYIKCVVPSEIPSGNSLYFDAIKAQAVCARTYALGRMADRQSSSFDVYDDHRDQVYLGTGIQTDLGNEAVDLTRGDVLMYNDSLATVFYHSTCGGILEAAEDVWPGFNAPYLEVEQDALGDQFACFNSPYFRWKRQFTITQLDSLFQKMFGTSFLQRTVDDTTTIHCRVKVTNRTTSGRVNALDISLADTIVALKNYEIRRFFEKNQRNLPSTLFQVHSENDSLLVLEGAGFGHGVGMCQWGALHMAEKGFKYYDILVNKYFRGTYLKKVY